MPVLPAAQLLSPEAGWQAAVWHGLQSYQSSTQQTRRLQKEALEAAKRHNSRAPEPARSKLAEGEHQATLLAPF